MNYYCVLSPRRRLRFAAALSFAVALSGSALLAQGGATGSIAGSVTSTATRNALQGATVTIPAQNRAEFTDPSGSFLIQSLPVGPVELVVNYSGFE